jgi:hypothetical protein
MQDNNSNFNDSLTNKNGAKLDSLKRTKETIDNEIWTTSYKYYLENNNLNELKKEKQDELDSDYNARTKYYNDSLESLYNSYYDKLSLFYAQNNIKNKQIEIVNNTQYKILEQRDLNDNLTNDLTTQNRKKMYYDNIYRKNKTSIQNFSILLLFLILLIGLILALNFSKFTENNNKFAKAFYFIIKDIHSKFFPLYFIFILFIIIIFRQYNIAILFLLLFSVITLISSV